MVCRLHEVMGRHRLSQAALAQASTLRPGTIHALYHDRCTAVTLPTLAKLLIALYALTGHAYTVGDLLHFHRTPPVSDGHEESEHG